MEEILRWMKATEDNDTKFRPVDAFTTIGQEFTIGKLEDGIDSTKLLHGELVILETIVRDLPFFYIPLIERSEVLYWYQVKPTEETWKKYFDGN